VAGEGLRGRLGNAAGAFTSNARNPNLRRAQLSFLAAWTAEWTFTVGLGIVAYRDGGATAVGLVGLLRMAPSAILAPCPPGCSNSTVYMYTSPSPVEIGPMLGSAPAGLTGAVDDHSADALLTSAWLRRHADDAALWHPPELTPGLARTEGWTFGAA